MNRIIERIAKPGKSDLQDNRQRELDKIHQDEMKNYDTNNSKEDVDNNDGIRCDVCNQVHDQKDMYEHDYHFDKKKQEWVFRNVCKNCLDQEFEEQANEDKKHGQEEAEKIQKEYNLSNSHNADEIEEPHLRAYVQALLSYYNSWGDYDGGYTKYCERALERASEEYANYLDSQKGKEDKKANRIVDRLQKTAEDFKKKLNKQAYGYDQQREYLLSQLMPWWKSHFWNPATLNKKNLNELLALRNRMLEEERKLQQQKPKAEEPKQEEQNQEPQKPSFEQTSLF